MVYMYRCTTAMLAGLAYPVAPPLAGCTREGDEDGLCVRLDTSSGGRSVEVGVHVRARAAWATCASIRTLTLQ